MTIIEGTIGDFLQGAEVTQHVGRIYERPSSPFMDGNFDISKYDASLDYSYCSTRGGGAACPTEISGTCHMKS